MKPFELLIFFITLYYYIFVFPSEIYYHYFPKSTDKDEEVILIKQKKKFQEVLDNITEQKNINVEIMLALGETEEKKDDEEVRIEKILSSHYSEKSAFYFHTYPTPDEFKFLLDLDDNTIQKVILPKLNIYDYIRFTSSCKRIYNFRDIYSVFELSLKTFLVSDNLLRILSRADNCRSINTEEGYGLHIDEFGINPDENDEFNEKVNEFHERLCTIVSQNVVFERMSNLIKEQGGGVSKPFFREYIRCHIDNIFAKDLPFYEKSQVFKLHKKAYLGISKFLSSLYIKKGTNDISQLLEPDILLVDQVPYEKSLAHSFLKTKFIFAKPMFTTNIIGCLCASVENVIKQIYVFLQLLIKKQDLGGNLEENIKSIEKVLIKNGCSMTDDFNILSKRISLCVDYFYEAQKVNGISLEEAQKKIYGLSIRTSLFGDYVK